MTVAVGDELVVGLEGFGGLVLKPGDAGYEEERRVHNGLIDKRPALIARCRCVADIVDGVKLAANRSSKSPSAVAVTTWPGSRRSTAA